MKVLVVEDDARIAGVVQQSLAEAGYAVDLAATAPAAIEAFEIETYDLVVLDLMLPGARGVSPNPRVRQRHAGSHAHRARFPQNESARTRCRSR